MATALFFDKRGNKIQDNIAEAAATALVRWDKIGGERIIATENGATTIHLGRLSDKSFVLDRTITTGRNARGVCMARDRGAILDPGKASGNLAYITTRANS